MVYVVRVGQVECWFAAFNQEEEWKLQTANGVNGNKLEAVWRNARGGE
jgi:hypothetical protein